MKGWRTRTAPLDNEVTAKGRKRRKLTIGSYPVKTKLARRMASSTSIGEILGSNWGGLCGRTGLTCEHGALRRDASGDIALQTP